MSNSKNPKAKRVVTQPGSFKIWYNPQNNTAWASVDVHNGRTTTRVRGPEARDPEAAVELLRTALLE